MRVDVMETVSYNVFVSIYERMERTINGTVKSFNHKRYGKSVQNAG